MVVLFVSTYNTKVVSIPNSTPIEVGALNRKCIYPIKDCTGVSISSLNDIFGELTGIYWIWKNRLFSDGDRIGFCHYNKYLRVSHKKVEKLVDNNTWVVPKCGQGLVKHRYQEDMDVLLEVLFDIDTSLYYDFLQLYNKDGSSKKDVDVYSGQLFYCTWKEYCAYCDFMFTILMPVYEKIGRVEREAYHNRYAAFLGERLLTLYIYHNKKNTINAPIESVSRYRIFNIAKKIVPSKIKRLSLSNKMIKRMNLYSSSWSKTK